MGIRDRLICSIYAAIALIALPATWLNNIEYIKQADSAFAIGAFIQDAYVNAAAASLTNDLFALATATIIFMVIEGRRLEIRFLWLYLLLSPLIAISFSFPLFLLARHLKLVKIKADVESATLV